MRKILKNIILSNNILRHICNKILQEIRTWKSQTKVENLGNGKMLKYVNGGGNKIIIGKRTFVDKLSVRIVGNNNLLEIGTNCHIGPSCSFWLEGNNCHIKIGDNTTMTCEVHINAQECGSSIIIGDDCMFSNKIIIRTSDSHPIYDIESNKRINPAKNIHIGNHVWIAPQSTIMKGVNIGDGAIIGSHTLVTKDVNNNSLVVGYPAREVKSKINWTREDIISSSNS